MASGDASSVDQIVAAAPEVIALRPSGLKLISLSAPPASNSVSCCPVAPSQIRAVPSRLAVPISLPSGLKVALTTLALPGSVITLRRASVVAFQTRAVPSWLEVRTELPSGLNTALAMPAPPGSLITPIELRDPIESGIR